VSDAKHYETRFLVSEWGIWQNAKELDSAAREGNVTQRKVRFFQSLATQLEQLNSLGWQVIGSMPIEQGAFYATGLSNRSSGGSSWGGGYGYGATATAGMCLILQRPIDDFGSAQAQQRQRGYQVEMERQQKAWEIRYTGIDQHTPKTSLFAKAQVTYTFAGREFPSLEEAEAHRETVAKQMEKGEGQNETRHEI
jgi:hypothetical protein